MEFVFSKEPKWFGLGIGLGLDQYITVCVTDEALVVYFIHDINLFSMEASWCRPRPVYCRMCRKTMTD